MRSPFSLLDPWFLRRPFEGRAAKRYATWCRPAFGGLDQRILSSCASELRSARTVLDLGAGSGHFARRLAEATPACVLAVEPSQTFAQGTSPASRVTTLRARAESLPLARGSVDFAICLSSLRHVRDRRAALSELRRVVRDGGAALVVELDPASGRERARRHMDAMPSLWARASFRLWVLGACPPREVFAELARRAGFARVDLEADAEQPFYFLRLS
jgi:ubiquinone/menaquinone biosynthesis C-methylase UbiE